MQPGNRKERKNVKTKIHSYAILRILSPDHPCPIPTSFVGFFVYHGILLSKMNLHGIQGIALDWFKSYLTNRTQRCLVNGSLSRICSLKCGVPQGTILGPLLFLIYINGLPNCLTSCQPRMYADDTHITYADVDVNSIQLNLNHDLRNLNKWHISNELTFNTAKTEFMLIGSRQKLSTLSS